MSGCVLPPAALWLLAGMVCFGLGWSGWGWVVEGRYAALPAPVLLLVAVGSHLRLWARRESRDGSR